MAELAERPRRPAVLAPLPPRGSRLATAALLVTFLLLLAGLWVADRALARADAATRELAALHLPGGAARARDAASRAASAALAGYPPGSSARLRLIIWLLGGLALASVVVGLAHERRLVGRLADRSAELERLSNELMRVNRAKSEFLANVSHELRTPLNAIVGFVELLGDGVYGELTPRQTGPVQRIAVSATHLRQLVDQILDLAKIAAGRLEVQYETVDLRPFVFALATEIEPLVQAKGIALSLAVPASLPRLRTDPSHLRQILLNLLGNAVKFTPSGRITVRAALARRHPDGDATDETRRLAPRLPARLLSAARRRGAVGGSGGGAGPRWVAVQVIDTGVGIPASEQARIFDEFEQVGPRTGDAAVRGTGLGLAISRRLARLLGGDLTVESAPAQGATFTLWLRADA